jgi:outer membrane protein assembly factor BamB
MTQLRLWPGLAIVAAMWLGRLLPPLLGFGASAQFLARVVGGMAGGLAFLIWFLFFSRARWSDRVGGVALLIAAAAGTALLGHESIVLWLLWYGFPVLTLAFLAGLLVAERTGWSHRATVAAAVTLTCAFVTLLRVEGVMGNGIAQFAWRWAPSAEEQLLARDQNLPTEPTAPPPAPAVAAASTIAPETAPGASEGAPVQIDWPGFRGAERNGSVSGGVRIATDWSGTPPVEVWRQPIGPGWSSFAVRGGLLYTQEQRGDEELVTAYSTSTGKPVWRHRDTIRFNEPMGGPGPRATPSVDERRVYSLGATGILNALDAANGAVVWSRHAASEADVAVPTWGFAGSPLLVDDLVVIALGGKLAAYERASGRQRWVGPDGGDGYGSPQFARITGIPQVVMASGAGMVGVSPSDGRQLWSHSWATSLPLMPIAQPAVFGSTLIVGDSFNGVRRVGLGRNAEAWTVNELWSSIRLKPYFNDFVVHRGHAYGFDGAILACINLENGERSWKGGRYGQGQLVLLPDQDLLLVLSEEGELILVKAAPDQHTELARFPAIQGKTWNHPVLVGDILFVRNGEEMAAFRLAVPAQQP